MRCKVRNIFPFLQLFCFFFAESPLTSHVSLLSNEIKGSQFRLNGWDFTIRDIRKRPCVIGKWTNTIIYKELPKGVLEELKNKTPKNELGKPTAKYHQSLTLDVGEPNLERQITKVVALFQVSDNMQQFWNNFKKMKDRQSGLLDIPFEFDDEGHTKE